MRQIRDNHSQYANWGGQKEEPDSPAGRDGGKIYFRKLGPEKGVITKAVFSLEESLKSLNSLESLENGRILLYFQSLGTL